MAEARAAGAIDVDEVADAVRKSSHSVALIDLTTLEIVAHSEPAAAGLGFPKDANLDVLTIATDPDGARHSLADVRDGRFDAIEVSRALRRADGSVVEGVVWVRAIEPQPPRAHAVVVLHTPGTDTSAPTAPDVSAMLSLDAAQRVTRVSADGESVLGQSDGAATGRALAELVHPDDLDTLVRTISSVADTRTTAANQIRVRGADDVWRPVDLTVAPMGATDCVGCRAAPTQAMTASAAATSERIAELERHLTRIAREVEAAGVIRDGATVLDPERVPELAQLTARQWEILVRLLRGERVPTIARAMFLSPSTVRNYLSAMYHRLGVHSQAELIERFGNHDA